MIPLQQSPKQAILDEWLLVAQEFARKGCSFTDFAFDTLTSAVQLFDLENDNNRFLARELGKAMGGYNSEAVIVLHSIQTEGISTKHVERMINQAIACETPNEERQRKRLIDHALLSDQEFTQNFLYIMDLMFQEVRLPLSADVSSENIRRRLIERPAELKHGLN